MSRFAQWFCGLAAIVTLGYAGFIASVVDPAMLVTVWKTGQLSALLTLPAVFGAAWLVLWLYRGRPGRLGTGLVVVGAVAVLVAAASVWFHAVHGGTTEVREVQPTPRSGVRPSEGPASPGPPPPTAVPSPPPG